MKIQFDGLRSRRIPWLHFLAVSASLSISVGTAAAQDCVLERVNVNPQGGVSLASSGVSGITPDGRFVAFGSDAFSVVPVDTNGFQDAFVRDRQLGVTELVSLSDAGTQLSGPSGSVDISDDGRFVLFASWADDVHPDDTDTLLDYFVRDRTLGVTEWVSRRPAAGSVSGCKLGAEMSSDGRFVVFYSSDKFIVPSDADQDLDVFLVDRVAGTTTLVSVDASGVKPGGGGVAFPSVSDDGQRVAFIGSAPNWPLGGPNSQQAWLKDFSNGSVQLISVRPDGQPSVNVSNDPRVSGDGRFVTFMNRGDDLAPGEVYNGWIYDVYVRDLEAGATELITKSWDGGLSNHESLYPRITSDGRYVVFRSPASNLVTFDGNGNLPDVFVHDRSTKVTTLVSVGHLGQASTQGAYAGRISDDGRFVSFVSPDFNLLPGSGVFNWDAYLRECHPDATSVFCSALPNSLACLPLVSQQGTPSASQASGFDLICDRLISGSLGIFYYGKNGTAAGSLFGFDQCVQPPTFRTPVAATGGPSSPQDCTGSLSIDFNTWIASGTDPSLIAGTVVYGQFWSRDPAAASTVHLSPAVAFTIQP